MSQNDCDYGTICYDFHKVRNGCKLLRLRGLHLLENTKIQHASAVRLEPLIVESRPDK